MFVVIFGTSYICKFINRTLVKGNLLQYNLSIKGGFTINNTLFEQFSGTYTKQDNYLLSNLTLPAEEETGYIGVWGQRRLNYLMHHHKVLYYNLLTSGKLHSPLADTEKQAQQLFSRLVKQYAEKEGIIETEQLKEENQMEWVVRMNNIHSRVTEIVNKDLIYNYPTAAAERLTSVCRRQMFLELNRLLKRYYYISHFLDAARISKCCEMFLLVIQNKVH